MAVEEGRQEQRPRRDPGVVGGLHAGQPGRLRPGLEAMFLQQLSLLGLDIHLAPHQRTR